ncbi:MAG: ABC transporter permease, partial [Clostridia bacterium]
RRELRAYFTGPIGYIFCAIFVFLCNFSFYSTNLVNYISDFSPTFNLMMLFLMVLVPLMTMRLWSEERRQKTDQLLLTAPVTTTGVVMGKFLSALTVFLISLAFTLIYPVLVAMRGTPDFGRIIGNYIGIILAASAYIAISLFISSLTKSQIVAAIFSMLALLAFQLMDIVAGMVTSTAVAGVLGFLSMITRFFNIFRGIFALSDILYFISLTVIFLFLTSRVIEKQRWS